MKNIKADYQPLKRTFYFCPICGSEVKKEIRFEPYTEARGPVEQREVKAYVPGIKGAVKHVEKLSGKPDHRVNIWRCNHCDLGFRYKDILKHVIKVVKKKETITCKEFKQKIN